MRPGQRPAHSTSIANARGGGQIGDQPSLTAGTAHGAETRAVDPAMAMQNLQCLQHVFRTVRFNHPALCKEGSGRCRAAGQCGGMRACGLCRGLGLAGFDGDNRFAARRSLAGHGSKISRIDKALNIDTGGGNPFICQQGASHIAEGCLRLIANAGDIGDRQAARLHADIDRDVG